MNLDRKETWETYVASWKTTSVEEKRRLFERCLAARCVYTDPLVRTVGWDELLRYMQEFHKQIPGGYFATEQFMDHHEMSMARWTMRQGDENAKIGEGVSLGEYDDTGRLIRMTGFFEVPGN